MKIIRYEDSDGKIGFAAQLPNGKTCKLQGEIYRQPQVTDQEVQVRKILAPIVPSALFCIGLNYRQHAIETGSPMPANPILFMKNFGAVQNPDDPILIPTGQCKSTEVDFECELAVVIGQPCKNVSRADALKYVVGYTCANDVSARDWQGKWGGSQWCRGKTFDTFAPLGPCLVTTDEITNPNTLGIRTILNGEVMQSSNTSDMIFDVPTLIEFLSASTTLWPGTVILTGTPQGVGVARKPQVFMKAGDTIRIEIDGIGTLTNPVQDEEIA